MGLISNMIQGYNDIYKYADPRVKDWPFMSGWGSTVGIVAVYIVGITIVGPKLMRNRKPYELKEVLFMYNLFQVLFSAWMFLKGFQYGWWDKYSFRCEPLDTTNSYTGIGMASICWWYLVSKFTEFLDTVFFIMRKKFNQVSVLHVIHHAGMPLAVWWGVKFYPGGHLTFFGVFNTFVHVVMYTYYLLSSLGPQVQKYLWWKKHLTGLQLLQFIAVFIHSAQTFFSDCDVPKLFPVIICSYAMMFIILFSNFYIKSYTKPQHKKKIVEKQEVNANVITANVRAEKTELSSSGTTKKGLFDKLGFNLPVCFLSDHTVGLHKME
ncbi:very long chain fatty acid elongase 7-like isoform X2 [Artemia franciscana]|uniref:very long chain fatty acid elongase 7-like isoform X2 n=1 Tax=Artemia franciscana TaxID=6661 RepID=UPI0032DB4634